MLEDQDLPLGMYEAIALPNKTRGLQAVRNVMRNRFIDEVAFKKTLYIVPQTIGGEIPLHIACKDDKNEQIVEQLLETYSSYQLKAQNKVFGNTPLHVAASIGTEKIVNVIFTKLPRHHEQQDNQPLANGLTLSLKDALEARNFLGDTPVHCAAARGHLSILKAMHNKLCPQDDSLHDQYNDDCITEFKGRFDGWPLHSACGYGRIEVVKKLVEWNPNLEKKSKPVELPAFTTTIEAKEFDEGEDEITVRKKINKLSNKEKVLQINEQYQQTPLTRACQFGHAEVVEFLLEKGAKPHPLALIKAIEGLYEECVRLLLFSSKPKNLELLNFKYIPIDSPFITTPLNELIKHMPDTAEAVLHKCTHFERFLVNSKKFKIRMNYEFVDIDTNHSGVPQPSDLIKILSSEQTSKKGFIKKIHPLRLMVQYKRNKLLTHPLVASLIHDKWRLLLVIFSLIQYLCFYLPFLVCVNALLFTLPSPSSTYCSQVQNATDDAENMAGSSCCECDDDMDPQLNLSMSLMVRLETNAAFLMFFAIVQFLITSILPLVVWFIELCTKLKKLYKFELNNKNHKASLCCELILGFFEGVSYIRSLTSPMLFLLAMWFSGSVIHSKKSNPAFCVGLNWHLGVIVLWLSWIELIFISMQFRIIGVYAIMFIKVFKTFLKLIPLASMLIIGFGLTFHFLFCNPEIKASPFYTPGYSFLKILSMTTGDLDINKFFGFDFYGINRTKIHIQYEGLTTFFWIISLILLTVLFTNLLIGLAVGDIKSIHDRAKFEKLAIQVEYILAMENTLSCICACLQKCGCQKMQFKNKSSRKLKPNKLTMYCSRQRMFDEFIYLVWGGIRCDSHDSIQRLESYELRKKKNSPNSLYKINKYYKKNKPHLSTYDNIV